MSNFIVTITGADDGVDPIRLAELSKEFPFVEWGILFSNSQPGKNRYPSKLWRQALYARCMSTEWPMNLSAHICGALTDVILGQQDSLVTEVDIFFRRIQFNKVTKDNLPDVLKYVRETSTQCIIQSNESTKQNVLISNSIVELKSRISILNDASLGNGVSTEVWPEHDSTFMRCGYAGGINEDNVEAHLETLCKRYGAASFWIDLETGARNSENEFSLEVVGRILKKAAKFHALTKDKEIQVPKSQIILA